MPAWYPLQLDPWQLSLKYSNSATELPSDSVAQLVRAWQAICQVAGSSPSLSHCQFLFPLYFFHSHWLWLGWLSGLEHVKHLSLMRLTLCARGTPPSCWAWSLATSPWWHSTVLALKNWNFFRVSPREVPHKTLYMHCTCKHVFFSIWVWGGFPWEFPWTKTWLSTEGDNLTFLSIQYMNEHFAALVRCACKYIFNCYYNKRFIQTLIHRYTHNLDACTISESEVKHISIACHSHAGYTTYLINAWGVHAEPKICYTRKSVRCKM